MIQQKHWPFASAFATAIALGLCAIGKERSAPPKTDSNQAVSGAVAKPAETTSARPSARRAEMAPFVKKGVDWLIAAQNETGGWGSGSLGQDLMRNIQKRFAAPPVIDRGPLPNSSAQDMLSEIQKRHADILRRVG